MSIGSQQAFVSPRDCDGNPIKIGDVVEHIYGPWPPDHVKEHRKDPSNPCWCGDGFPGKRRVIDLTSNGVIVQNIGGRIPHYLGAFCRIVDED